MSINKDSISYFWKGTDKVLLFLCLITSAFGALMVYSATRHTVDGTGFPRDALTMIVAIIIGVVIALVLSAFDFDAYCKLWWLWGSLGILLMILVMLIGVAPSAREDARTWINLGIIYFQPSELVKAFFITTFSVHLYAFKERMNSIRNVLLLTLHLLIPFVLVAMSGDDGSALVFFLIGLNMIFVAGLNWKYIVSAFAIVAAAIPLFWSKLSEFQRQRFVVIWNPERYPATAYQQNQGLAAIYNGGFLGTGLFKGQYTQSGAVPESWNDMIFTVIGEELGVIGGLIAVGLLTAIVLRIIHNGRVSIDGPAQYACIGISSMIAIQTFINLAMVFRIGPVIGITLPFFSAGGSSTLCLYVAIGLVMSIYRSYYTETRDNSMHLIGVVSPFKSVYSDDKVDQDMRTSAHRFGQTDSSNHSRHEDTKITNSLGQRTKRQVKRITRKANAILPDYRHGRINYDFDHKNRKSPPSHATFKKKKNSSLPSGAYYKPRSGSSRAHRYDDENRK